MAIQIGKYNFEGPYPDTNNLRAQSGVYVILGKTGGNNWNVVDIGESGNVKDRISTHDRSPCWKKQGHAELAVAVLHVNEQQRMSIERELRANYNPPCGDR
jgi:hypothetical protein